MTSNTTQNRQKRQKDENTSFTKESVENADLYKSVLNNIMTTHVTCYILFFPCYIVSPNYLCIRRN